MKRVFTLNKKAITKEEAIENSRYYKGLTCTRDTMTEEVYDDNDHFCRSNVYYVFKGSWTPYGGCVKHGDNYVFARSSRYDAIKTVNETFEEFVIDCDEFGHDDKIFTTHHFTMSNNEVKY